MNKYSKQKLNKRKQLSVSEAPIYFAPGRVAKYCNDRVCVSVREHISGTTRLIFTKFLCMLPMWPWLGPLLVPLRYFTYFRFYGWRHICNTGTASQPEGAARRLGRGLWLKQQAVSP